MGVRQRHKTPVSEESLVSSGRRKAVRTERQRPKRIGSVTMLGQAHGRTPSVVPACWRDGLRLLLKAHGRLSADEVDKFVAGLEDINAGKIRRLDDIRKDLWRDLCRKEAAEGLYEIRAKSTREMDADN